MSLVEIQQGVYAMKRTVMSLTTAAIGLALGIAMSTPSAYATAGKKVDCDAVMQEVNAGKKTKEIAKDMSISASSVYKCKKKEMAAAKTAAKAGNEVASPEASPAAAPKP
jgi:hypothetical protein